MRRHRFRNHWRSRAGLEARTTHQDGSFGIAQKPAAPIILAFEACAIGKSHLHSGFRLSDRIIQRNWGTVHSRSEGVCWIPGRDCFSATWTRSTFQSFPCGHSKEILNPVQSAVSSQAFRRRVNRSLGMKCFDQGDFNFSRFAPDSLSVLQGHTAGHTRRKSLFYNGCLAWIRTMTNRSRICSATVTPRGNEGVDQEEPTDWGTAPRPPVIAQRPGR